MPRERTFEQSWDLVQIFQALTTYTQAGLATFGKPSDLLSPEGRKTIRKDLIEMIEYLQSSVHSNRRDQFYEMLYDLFSKEDWPGLITRLKVEASQDFVRFLRQKEAVKA